MHMSGGYIGHGLALAPEGATTLWSGTAATLWCADDGASPVPVRAAEVGAARIAAVGFCGAADHDLLTLAERGIRGPEVFSWPGAYALVEARPGRLSLFTDLAAAVPLYWVSTGDGYAWSTSARALAALVGADVDQQWLSAWLAWPGTTAVISDRAAFAGVAMIPPGYRLDLAPDRPPRLAPAWRPEPEARPDPGRLGDQLRAAVHARTRLLGSVSCDLSGGIDSTTLARLAAAELAERGRSIGAVTFHPAGVVTGGDLDFAHLGGAHPGIDHRWLPRDHRHLPYAAVPELPATDEPAPGAAAAPFWLDALQFARREFGHGHQHHHLTGDGGDAVLTAPLSYLADLLRGWGRRRGLAEAIGWASLYRASAWPLIRDAWRTASTTRTAELERVATAVRLGRASGGIAGWFPAPALPAGATAALREYASDAIGDAAERAAGLAEPAEIGAHVMWENVIEVGRSAASDGHLAAGAVGVVQHNPFVDSAVIAAVLAGSPSAWASPHRFKPLLGAALRGVLPEPIASRTTKGELMADHVRGLRANAADLRDLVADGYLAGAGLIDPVEFGELLTRAGAGALGSLGRIQPVIAAEVWHRSLMNDRPPVWPVAGAREVLR